MSWQTWERYHGTIKERPFTRKGKPPAKSTTFAGHCGAHCPIEISPARGSRRPGCRGDFFNEICLLGYPRCLSKAVTITPGSIRAIEKEEMIRILCHGNGMAICFRNRLLSSTMRFREDVVDLQVNSTEKQLACLLLRLAHAGSSNRRMARLPAISQQALAEMVGTTRSRVNFFMNRFRKQGLVHYKGGLEIRRALRKVLPRAGSHQASRKPLLVGENIGS